ncbi:hypothetical protein ACYOEI_25815, partial [Singulisphaera rosea]
PVPWAIGAGFSLLLVSAFWIRRRRRRTRAGASIPPPPGTRFSPSDTPRERMIYWSLTVREALTVRFGDAWRAKTTEEIATDPGLLTALGSDHALKVVGFLLEADRAKFADSIDLESYTDLDFQALTELITSAAKESTTNGKPRSRGGRTSTHAQMADT